MAKSNLSELGLGLMSGTLSRRIVRTKDGIITSRCKLKIYILIPTCTAHAYEMHSRCTRDGMTGIRCRDKGQRKRSGPGAKNSAKKNAQNRHTMPGQRTKKQTRH